MNVDVHGCVKNHPTIWWLTAGHALDGPGLIYSGKVLKPVKLVNKLSLVGGFNPFEKYARQIGNLPQIGMKIKNI